MKERLIVSENTLVLVLDVEVNGLLVYQKTNLEEVVSKWQN
jgi:hypothetical protein